MLASEGFESSSSSEHSQESEQETEDSDMIEVFEQYRPYEGEPLGHSSDDNEHDVEVDEDGLSPAVLRSRFEGEVSLNEWCKCGHCNTEGLVGALEFRCCREVAQCMHKLLFDGSIERVSCVTMHDDFGPMTNIEVLTQVAPLLKDRNGRGYRRRAGQSQNDFLRAVAYRWLIRWTCGYMGWDNTRPLPACIYHQLRNTFPTCQARGYQTAQERL